MTAATDATIAPPMTLTTRALRYEAERRVILDSVDLTVEPGQSIAITGPSGSGKTTLLLCLAGLLPAASGQIHLGNTELTSMRAKEKTALRLTRIGIVYQFGELISELSPVENVALPGLLAGYARSATQQRAAQLLDDVGIGDLASAQTATLSGGERQRVAVARALINRPSVLLADEPTGSLDHASTGVVADLLVGLPGKHGCSLIMVTHNAGVAERADRQLLLEAGYLMEAGA